jgi:cation diffusion facilitator family transporter
MPDGGGGTVLEVQANHKIAMRISRENIVLNSLLSMTKFVVGFIANSSALVNDAINNASDVVSSVIVIVGLHAASKESDTNHQYGHERMECVASILLSGIVMAVGFGLGAEGIRKIATGSYRDLPAPGTLAIFAAVASILVKEFMFLHTRREARKIDSSALMASAWDSQSDVLATTGGLVGIVASRWGFPIADSLAALLIAGFIVKVGIQIFTDGMNKMVDHACPPETVEAISNVVLDQEGVLSLDLLNTRQFSNRAYVDVEISADRDLKLIEAHAIAERVHHAIEYNFPQVKHCMVHVNPYMVPKPSNSDER